MSTTSSIYLRIKRGKQIYFVSCKPSDTIHKLKQNLSLVLHKLKDPKQIRHLLSSNARLIRRDKDAQTVLENTATINGCGLGNDGVVYMVFPLKEDGSDAWEAIAVPEFEPLFPAATPAAVAAT